MSNAPERVWIETDDYYDGAEAWENATVFLRPGDGNPIYIHADIAASATRAAVRDALAQAERIALIHVDANSAPRSITDTAMRTMAHRLWDDIRALAATYAEPTTEEQAERAASDTRSAVRVALDRVAELVGRGWPVSAALASAYGTLSERAKPRPGDEA